LLIVWQFVAFCGMPYANGLIICVGFAILYQQPSDLPNAVPVVPQYSNLGEAMHDRFEEEAQTMRQQLKQSELTIDSQQQQIKRLQWQLQERDATIAAHEVKIRVLVGSSFSFAVLPFYATLCVFLSFGFFVFVFFSFDSGASRVYHVHVSPHAHCIFRTNRSMKRCLIGFFFMLTGE
jgi:hypothetical protein